MATCKGLKNVLIVSPAIYYDCYLPIVHVAAHPGGLTYAATLIISCSAPYGLTSLPFFGCFCVSYTISRIQYSDANSAVDLDISI